MSQTTINASVKGTVRSNTNTNWPAAQSATSGNVETYTKVQCQKTSGGVNLCRAYLIFDTSSLADNVTVSAATLSGKVNTLVRDYSSSVRIHHVTMASNTQVTNTDYNKSNFGQLLLSTNTLTNASVNTFSLSNYTINATGYTKIGLINTTDFNGSDPGEVGSWEFNLNDSTPQLILTWTTPPIVTTSTTISDLQPISATLGGNVTDAGGGTVSTRGVCWNTSTNPTTSNSKTATTGTTGAFTVSATGLLPGTLYYCRAYVTTENSTTYGSDVTFRTPGGAILFNLL
jgi:hypothetical protein